MEQIVVPKQISIVLNKDTGGQLVPITPPPSTPFSLGLTSDYVLSITKFVKDLRCRTNIASLRKVPFPVLELGLSDSEKLAIIEENERNNPHKMLQILLGGEDGIFGEIGNMIMPNRGKSYNNRLFIFFSDGDVMELAKESTMAVRVVDDGYGLLSSWGDNDDFIHIYGLYKEQIFMMPTATRQLQYKQFVSSIGAGVAINILEKNQDRQHLVITNASDLEVGGRIWVQISEFEQAKEVGIPLWPGGSYTWIWNLMEKPMTSGISIFSESGAQVAVVEGY